MIYLYSGTPGSGKSYHIAKDLYGWLQAGRDCICNFPLALDKIPHRRGRAICLDNDDITPAYLIRFASQHFAGRRPREGDIKLVIDEAQLIYNAREWQRNDRKEWMAFFSQHRKYGYDVYLIAQMDGMLDRQVRGLLEYNIVHRKMANYGLQGKLLSLFWGGRAVCAVKIWYPLKQRVSSEIFAIQRRYFAIYDTYLDFTGAAGLEPPIVQDVQSVTDDRRRWRPSRSGILPKFLRQFGRYAAFRWAYSVLRSALRSACRVARSFLPSGRDGGEC